MVLLATIVPDDICMQYTAKKKMWFCDTLRCSAVIICDGKWSQAQIRLLSGLDRVYLQKPTPTRGTRCASRETSPLCIPFPRRRHTCTVPSCNRGIALPSDDSALKVTSCRALTGCRGGTPQMRASSTSSLRVPSYRYYFRLSFRREVKHYGRSVQSPYNEQCGQNDEVGFPPTMTGLQPFRPFPLLTSPPPGIGAIPSRARQRSAQPGDLERASSRALLLRGG